MISLDALQPFVDRKLTQKLLEQEVEPRPDRAICGYLGRVFFIVSQDDDGYADASLTGNGRQPTRAQCRRFLALLGCAMTPPQQRIVGGNGFYWVLSVGRCHA